LHVVDLVGAKSEKDAAGALRYLIVCSHSGDWAPGGHGRPVEAAIESYLLCNCTHLRYLGWNGTKPGKEEERLPGVGADEAAGGAADTTTATLALGKRYRGATTEGERRDILLEAVDAGLIREGMPVSIMDKVFGTQCARNAGPECLVEFAPAGMRPGGRTASEPAYGYMYARSWFFKALYDEHGRIGCFWLSNVHFKLEPV
jgi:hypothetical protein